MSKIFRWLLLPLLGTLLTTCRGQAAHDCPFPAGSHAPGDRCGYLVVPADRSRPDGKQVRIAYLVLRSGHEDRRPDPVVFLQGGPGGSVLPFLATFRQLAPDPARDFILFDARGTGYSGALCPELGPKLLDVLAADIPPAAEAGQLYAATETCRQHLREQEHAPREYTTSALVDDLEDLRRHLGYERWNLFGGSYGTRLALTYLDRYPEAVRSALLLGVFPPQARMYERLVSNFDRALSRAFTACAENEACHDRYPEPAKTLSVALARLREQPLVYTWRGRTFSLNAQDLLLFLHQQLYDRRTIGTIPALIQAAYDRDPAPFTATTTAVAQRLQAIDLAAYWSVMASDEASYPNAELIAMDLARVPSYGAGIGFFLSDPALLIKWRSSAADTAPPQTVHSDIPTLLISGELDPITPPAYAEWAAETLSRSHTVVFANEGHTPFNPCFFELARSFFREPSATPDPTCAGVKRPIDWR